VHLLVRSRKLSESMSQYLIARIEGHPRIEVHYLTQIVVVTGTAHLESIEWKDDSSGFDVTMPIRHVFVMAGAAPRTEWLEDCFVLDKRDLLSPDRTLWNTRIFNGR
jgi:thioredoxin reductase (NADPH)